jgi:CHAT domain-containing protein/tetratricopeptide (TPR) repeat protein
MRRPTGLFRAIFSRFRRRTRASESPGTRPPARDDRALTSTTPLRRSAVLALVLVACGTVDAHSPRESAWSDAPREGLVGELARLRLERRIGPRLSISSDGGYAPCSLLPPPDSGTVPVTRCSPSKSSRSVSERIARISARASKAVRDSVDPDALHAAALIDLLWSDGAGNSLQRSISYLQSAARLTDRPGPVLADLSAALLVRAERMQNVRDLFEAIETADQALGIEPRNAAARFNLALALDILALDGQATGAWEQYLMLDATSGWANAATERQRAMATAPVLPRRPQPGASLSALEAYARQAPQEARVWGWDELLGRWGDALLAGDSARAGERLRQAEAVGDGLARRNKDATLVDAIRAIRSHARDPFATRELARAHQAYAAGRSAYVSARFAEAGARFAEAIAIDPPSPPLIAWARAYQAATLGYAGQTAAGERLLGEVGERVDTLRHPALAGSVSWFRATILLRTGRYEPAREAALGASRHFARASEDENTGGARYLTSDTEFALKATGEAYATAHRALVNLRPYRSSVWRHTLLSVTGEEVAADGLLGAAVRLQNEGITVAERTGRPLYVAEALLWRAQLLAARGDAERAERDIQIAGEIVRGLSDEQRRWLDADLQMAQARTALRTAPSRALAALDSVVAASGGAQTELRLLGALVARAQARLALGDPGGTAADLDRATALLARQRDAVSIDPLRTALLDAARGVFDQLVMLRLAAGDTVGSLAYLERGRASFAPTGSPASIERRPRWRLPRGTVAVDYALIGDTLLAWTLVDSTVHLTRSTLDRAALVRTIERVRSSLELQASEPATRPDLEALYDWLISPVEPALGGPGTRLVLVTDGELAGLPFAALRDTRRKRYLVEDHPLRFTSSLHEATQPQRSHGAAGLALFVVDPAFSPTEYPGLRPLPQTREEIGAAAAWYRDTVVIAGVNATRDVLESRVRRAHIFHFAGHAVFDEERPERSFLVLARSRGRRGSDRLTAAEVERMDLIHVRVVVLSACETLGSTSVRSGGLAGFAGAFLAAGAGGVVGSMWRVDDAKTRPLMVAFHRAYSTSGDGPEALRRAQLAILRSPDPALRTPAAWAAFRYVGS